MVGMAEESSPRKRSEKSPLPPSTVASTSRRRLFALAAKANNVNVRTCQCAKHEKQNARAVRACALSAHTASNKREYTTLPFLSLSLSDRVCKRVCVCECVFSSFKLYKSFSQKYRNIKRSVKNRRLTETCSQSDKVCMIIYRDDDTLLRKTRRSHRIITRITDLLQVNRA